jgi:glyoxylase-like metal-dependent hydrolase (beta-lactamase superfamily II)
MNSRIAALSLVLATSSLGCSASAPPPAQPSAIAAPEPLVSNPIATFTSDAAGFDTHSFWLDTGREVVVFDAQFTEDLARKLIAEIGSKTQSPIRYVVITHPNPDKFNGVGPFKAIGAKVVASESTAKAIPEVHAYKKHFFVNVAKMFTDATYPPEATVDITFKGDFDLSLDGSTKVKLHELSHSGVSSSQTVAFVPALNALIVGDLVHAKAHAWLEGGIVQGKATPDLASWKLALGELLAYKNATVYGGRGVTASVESAVTAEQAYLEKMNAIVAKYVADLGPAKSELSLPNAGDHYKKIAALATEAFPDYSLPYMIQYGVYGLVNQVASR